MNETWICKKGKWIKATKWDLWWRNFKLLFTKWKIVDTTKYRLITWKDNKRVFMLSPLEYENAQKISKEKGNISYILIPGTIGWGVKVKVNKTGEEIDITDVSSW